jgi:hypothetical protein
MSDEGAALNQNILQVELDPVAIEQLKEFFPKGCRAFGAHSRSGANLPASRPGLFTGGPSGFPVM